MPYPMHAKKKLFIAIITLTALLLIRFVLLPGMGSYLVQQEALRDASAIVLLLGSTPERELEVAGIYHQGFAPVVIMTEFRVHNHELIEAHDLDAPSAVDTSRSVLEQLGVPATAIRTIPGEVSSTRGEAKATAQYLLNNRDIQSVILVSSPYHMRRATRTFRREFRKTDIHCAIIPRASAYSDFNARRWWSHRDSAIAVALEYTKLIFSR